MEEILRILQEIGLPFAYDHFAEGESPDPPFAVYLIPESDNFSADGTAYYRQKVVNIEVYTDEKDPALERKVEAILIRHGIFYEKSETWIPDEKMYEVLFSFETEDEEDEQDEQGQ